MTQSALNSILEISTRALLVLYRSQQPRAICDIAALDYLASYAKSFNIGETNLNGDGEFNFNEFADRLHAIDSACAYLGRRGLITAHMGLSGFTYSITPSGREFCDQLTSEYATDYQLALDTVFAFENKHPDLDLSFYINKEGAKMPKVGAQ